MKMKNGLIISIILALFLVSVVKATDIEITQANFDTCDGGDSYYLASNNYYYLTIDLLSDYGCIIFSSNTYNVTLNLMGHSISTRHSGTVLVPSYESLGVNHFIIENGTLDGKVTLTGSEIYMRDLTLTAETHFGYYGSYTIIPVETVYMDNVTMLGNDYLLAHKAYINNSNIDNLGVGKDSSTIGNSVDITFENSYVNVLSLGGYGVVNLVSRNSTYSTLVCSGDCSVINQEVLTVQAKDQHDIGVPVRVEVRPIPVNIEVSDIF
jgi:hypothetical protein